MVALTEALREQLCENPSQSQATCVEYKVPEAEAVQNALPPPEQPGTNDTPHVKRFRLVFTRNSRGRSGPWDINRICVYVIESLGKVGCQYVGFWWLNA